nr:interleukin-10 isoform X3 [Columba livia]
MPPETAPGAAVTPSQADSEMMNPALGRNHSGFAIAQGWETAQVHARVLLSSAHPWMVQSSHSCCPREPHHRFFTCEKRSKTIKHIKEMFDKCCKRSNNIPGAAARAKSISSSVLVGAPTLATAPVTVNLCMFICMKRNLLFLLIKTS